MAGESNTNISDECKQAMIQYGTLMFQGMPAGVHLMNQDTIRIALVESDNHGAYPEEFLTDELTDFVTHFQKTLDEETHVDIDILNNAAQFPHENMQNITRDALAHWYTGTIEFVGLDEDPDIQIFAYQDPEKGTLRQLWETVVPEDPEKHRTYGFASYPRNDVEDIMVNKSSRMGYMGLNVDELSDPVRMTRVIEHEIGHTFGIVHPFAAIRLSEIVDPQACSDEEESALLEPKQEGIMAYGDHEETWYDTGTRDLIRNPGINR